MTSPSFSPRFAGALGAAVWQHRVRLAGAVNPLKHLPILVKAHGKPWMQGIKEKPAVNREPRWGILARALHHQGPTGRRRLPSRSPRMVLKNQTCVYLWGLKGGQDDRPEGD